MTGAADAKLGSGLYPEGNREPSKILEQGREWATFQTLSSRGEG